MTFTATGEPSNLPPRIHLELDTDAAGATFLELTVYRDGSPIRLQPPTGTEATETYDYEMPFGEAVDYMAAGSYLPFVAAEWTENWASLASWTGDTADWSLGAGDTVTSTVFLAEISRSTASTIQRFKVTDPVSAAFNLRSATDEDILSIGMANGLVALVTTVATSISTEGSGSFTLTLLDGVATATAADSSWTLSLPYSGTPAKVNVVSYGGLFGQSGSFAVTGNPDLLAVSSAGTRFVLDQATKTVRKYNSSGVFQASWSVTGTPVGIDADSSDNTYVADAGASLIRKYNSTGTAGITWSTTGTVADVAVDGANGVYALDSTNDLVRKYTATGTAGITWAFIDPHRIAANKTTNNVAVSDSSESDVTVEAYTSAGASIDGFTISTGPDGADVQQVALGNDNTVALDNDLFAIDAGTDQGTASIGAHIVGGVAFAGTTLLVGDKTDDTVVSFTASTATVGTVEVTPAVTPVAFLETETVTLNVTQAWLIHPAQPTLSASIDSGAWRDTGLNVDSASSQQHVGKATTTLHYPVGRPRPVAVVHGNRLEDEWQLVLLAPTIATRDTVKNLLDDQTPLLLRSPASFNYDLPDGFYSVQDVDYSRLTANLTDPIRRITLPLIPTDPPVIRVNVDRTWADVIAQNDTWADVVVKYDTWNDLLLGTS